MLRRTIVSVDRDRSVVAIDNLEYFVWERQNQAFMGWLLSSNTESTLGSVIECRTLFEVWTALQKQFSI